MRTFLYKTRGTFFLKFKLCIIWTGCMNCIGNSLSFNYHLFSFQAICKNSYLFKFCIFLYSFLFLAIQLGIYLCTFCFLSSLSIVFPCFSMISSVWDTDPVCTSNNKSIRKFLCDSTARLDFSLLLLVLLSLLILFSYFFVCQFFSLLLFFNLRSNSENFPLSPIRARLI